MFFYSKNSLNPSKNSFNKRYIDCIRDKKFKKLLI